LIFEEKQGAGKGDTAGKTEIQEYDAYGEAQESRDMAKRGFRDRIKFSNKRTRRDAEGFVGDVDMADVYPAETAPPKKKTVKFDGRQKGGAFLYRTPV